MTDIPTNIPWPVGEIPTEIPIFVCDQCDRTFDSRGALHVHVRSHDAKQPCPECGDLYQPGPGMSRHRQGAHGALKANGKAAKKPGERVAGHRNVVCEHCGKTLRSDNLVRHLRSVHKIGETRGPSHDPDLTADDLFNGVVSTLFPNGVIPVSALQPLLRWRHATNEMLLAVNGD